jgi:hypothetical protein
VRPGLIAVIPLLARLHLPLAQVRAQRLGQPGLFLGIAHGRAINRAHAG